MSAKLDGLLSQKNQEQLHKFVQETSTDETFPSYWMRSYKSWKDLLPVLLEVLEEEKYINYMNGEVSGSKYKSLIINNICNSEWNTEIMPSLAMMFRDMSLEKEDHALVINVLCTRLQNIPLEELPPFVHQALRLCNNQDSKYLLEALRRYFTLRFSQANSDDTDTFETIDTISVKEIQDIESTVLYHIYQAAQLNHQHIRDYIRYSKNVLNAPEAILEPFMFSVLLTVASVCEDQVFEILHAIMSKRNENDNRRKNSVWLRKLIPDSCSIMTVMVNIIDASEKDRHLVLKGLVDLAFVLMATEQKSKTNAHPLCQIGVKVLQRIMRKHHETVATVLQTLIDKIIAGGLYISQYTDCLTYMCRKLPILVLEQKDSVINFLNQISSVPGEVSIFIISAIFPLINASADIREQAVLTLRMTLYRKGTFNRQMAISGLLEMLKNLKNHSLSGPALSSSQCVTSTSISGSSILTQVTLERGSQAVRSKTGYNRSLAYDLLGILRKCFTHEYEVRLHLYNSLYDVVSKNVDAAEYILEMLLPHFRLYFEDDENVVLPIKLELCTTMHGEQAISQEPLAELIFVLQKIYIKAALLKSSLVDELAVILESLCRRMPRVDTEHLNLDDNLDLNNSSVKSQEKLQNVLTTIKIYEALISFRIGAWSVNCTETAQSVKNLFKGYMNLVEFMKRVPKAKKGQGKNKKQNDPNNTTIKKAGRSSNIKLPTSILDLSIVCKSLSLFYLKSVPWANADQVVALIDYYDFYHYILRTLLQILQNVKTLTEYNLRKHKDQNMRIYCKIGKLLYDHIILDFKKVLDMDEQGSILALECFKELCCLICTTFSTELPRFLNDIVPDDQNQSDNLNAQLVVMISALRTSFRTFFGEKEEHEENSKKIFCTLLDIIRQLTQEINFYETHDDKIFESIMEFTQLEGMDSQSSLIIFQILLWIEERNEEYGELLIDITLSLCEKVGSVDKTEIPENNKFKIVHEDTALQLYNLANNSVKEKLENVSWLLVRLKAEQSIACPPGADLEAHQEKLRTQERSLCRQLTHIIQILYTLADVAIKPGPSTDFMFKNLQHLYNMLSNLTKYFYTKSSKQNAAFQSVKFIQVIQSAGKPLKSAFYNLITHTEENQKGKPKADSHVQRNKVLKETKIIPKVVYEIEQFHKEILLLEKKTGVPLETYIKHSITRDFRIKNTQLSEALEKMDISLLETQNSHRDNANTSKADLDVSIASSTSSTRPTPLKRRKRSDP
ncbi:Fanconi anemia group I protein isoform X3 [Odontomachus brunneus]|uniref:Fanconi anemia group I protein isoform X3 n=2 Tax=Odontomachus brunneus TaxID=486640 RepID=UPI0013F1C2AE|nr:Fanconi anemia group I protein isoform X3 [Odontomachus brunneus]